MELKGRRIGGANLLELGNLDIVHIDLSDEIMIRDQAPNSQTLPITREQAEFLAVILLHFANTGELLSDVDTPKNLT